MWVDREIRERMFSPSWFITGYASAFVFLSNDKRKLVHWVRIDFFHYDG